MLNIAEYSIMFQYSPKKSESCQVFSNTIFQHPTYSFSWTISPDYHHLFQSITVQVDAGESTLAKAAPKDSALRLVCLGFQQSCRYKESMQCWSAACCIILSHWGIGALARSAKPGSDPSLTFTCTNCWRKLDQVLRFTDIIDLDIIDIYIAASLQSTHLIRPLWERSPHIVRKSGKYGASGDQTASEQFVFTGSMLFKVPWTGRLCVEVRTAWASHMVTLTWCHMFRKEMLSQRHIASYLDIWLHSLTHLASRHLARRTASQLWLRVWRRWTPGNKKHPDRFERIHGPRDVSLAFFHQTPEPQHHMTMNL